MTTADDATRQHLTDAIAALEAQRDMLGDDAVDAAQGALKEKLAALSVDVHEPTDQRKQITVLFADVSGFTAMSETMDAEEVRDVMNALWERIDAALTDHGGRIDKHIGDAVMALFGAPVAREDDPEQAVRAGLAMQQAIRRFNRSHARLRQSGKTLAIRIGINTGWVLVGEVGTTAEYTAMGDTVNLAARLESAAPVGGILISHATGRQVRGLFDLQAQDPISVKGKSDPVRTFRVTGARPRAFRVPSRGVEGVSVPMIGRGDEMARLQQAVLALSERAASAMRPTNEMQHAIIAVGDAGVGKSRLLYELELWAEALADPPIMLRGRADPQTRVTPYGLLRDAVASYCGIHETDSAPEARETLRRAVVSVLGPDGEEAEPFIAHALGLAAADEGTSSADSQGARRSQDRAWRELARFLTELAGSGPGAVLMLEDLHWSDDATLDFLEHLLLRAAESPLLVLCSTRPTLGERRPAWIEPGGSFETIVLHPLSVDDSRALVDSILQHVRDLPTSLRDLIAHRSEGNPYFVEELVQILIEDGVVVPSESGWRVRSEGLAGLHVPATLTGVLQARIDRLSASRRTTLQQASVVGRVFWDEAVTILSGAQPDLDAVRRAGLVLANATSTFEGCREFLFKHALLQEVVYESVLLRERRRHHARVATWLVGRSGDRAGEMSGQIAFHFEGAGELALAAEWHGRAGEQAFLTYANVDALTHYDSALDLLDRQRELELTATDEPDGQGPTAGEKRRRFWLRLRREEVFDRLGRRDEQAADLDRLTELAADLGEVEQIDVLLGRANLCWSTDDFAGAGEAASRALELARASGASLAEGAARRQLGRVARETGDYEAALSQFEAAAQLFAASGDAARHANTVIQIGVLHSEWGHDELAVPRLRDGLALAEAVGSAPDQAWALDNMSIVHAIEGDYDAALACGDEALALAVKSGSIFREAQNRINLATIQSQVANHEAAVELTTEALRLSRMVQDTSGEALALINLGEFHRDLGRYDDSLAQLEPGLALARALERTDLEAAALESLAETYRERGLPGDDDAATRAVADARIVESRSEAQDSPSPLP